MQLSNVSLAVKSQQQQSVQPQAQNNNNPVATSLTSAKDAFQKTSTQKAPQFGGLCCSKQVVDINAKDEKGQTAVARATLYGDTSEVRKLVKKGADVSIADDDGKFPLMEAAESGHVPIASILLQGTNANINQKDNNNDTALLRAAFLGHAALVEFLLRKHADKSVINKQGHTALSEATLGKRLFAESNHFTSAEKVKYAKRFDKIIKLLQPQQQNSPNTNQEDEKRSEANNKNAKLSIFLNKD